MKSIIQCLVFVIIWTTTITSYGQSKVEMLNFGTYNGCPGQAQIIKLSFTGTAPFSVTYTENGFNPKTVSGIMTNTYDLSVSTTSFYTNYFIISNALDANGPITNLINNYYIINITPITVGSISSSSNIVCPGYSYMYLNGSQATNKIWQSSIDNVNFSNVPGVVNGASTINPYFNTKTYFRLAVYNTGCPANYTNTLEMDVYPTPSIMATANQTELCEGSGTTITTSNANTGTYSISEWQVTDSYTDFTYGSFVSYSNYSNSFYLNPSVFNYKKYSGNPNIKEGSPTGKSYYVRGKVSANCYSNLYTPIVTVKVFSFNYGSLTSTGAIPGYNSITMCSGQTKVIKTENINGKIDHWEIQKPGMAWETIPGTTNTTSITSEAYENKTSANIAYSYRAYIISGGPCIPAYTNIFSLVVKYAPNLVSTNPSSVCTPNTIDIRTAFNDINPSRTNFTNAYSVSAISPTGQVLGTYGTAFGYTYTDLASKFQIGTSGTYSIQKNYIDMSGSNLSCSSSVPINIQIDQPSVGGNITSNSTIVCPNSGLAQLTLSGHTGSIVQWETSSNASFSPATIIANTTNTLTTTPINATTYYRVLVKNGACTNTYSSTFTLNVENISLPSANETKVCGPASATLTAYGAWGNLCYRWYDASNNGNLLKQSNGVSDNTFTTPLLTNTTSYFVSLYNTLSGCEGPRKEVKANLIYVPAPTASNTSRCGPGQIVLNATSSTGNYAWYTTETGGNPIAQGAGLYTSITNTTTFYLSAISYDIVTCYSPRVPVVATLNPLPVMPTASDVSICGNGTVNLVANGAPVGGFYKWYKYSGLRKTSIDANDNTYSIFVPNTTPFEVSIVDDKKCEGPKKTVNAIVNQVPNISVWANKSGTLCSGTNVTLSASGSGTLYWYIKGESSPFASNVSSVTVAPTATTVYQAKVVSTLGCSNTKNFTVSIYPTTPNTVKVSPTAVCQGSTFNISYKQVSGFTIDVIQLTINATRISKVIFDDFVSTSETYKLNSPGKIRVRYRNNASGCVQTYDYDISSKPVPAPPIVTGGESCGTGSVTFNVINPVNDESYKWFSSTNTSSTPLAIGSNYTTPVLSANKDYYVVTESINSCKSTAVKVTANIKSCLDYSLHFDGLDDKALINYDPNLDLGTGPFTMEAFFKSNRATSNGGIQNILSSRNGTAGIMFGLWPDGHVWVQLSGTPNIGYDRGPTLLDGACHHIAVTRDELFALTFYVDGVATYQTGSGRNLSTGGNWYIGMDPIDNGNYFDGDIHSIRVWNKALNISELSQYSNATLTGSETGLVADWSFTEGSGTTTTSKGNAITATLGGASADINYQPTWQTPNCISFLRMGENETINIPSELPIDEKDVQVFSNPFENEARIRLIGFQNNVSLKILNTAGEEVWNTSKTSPNNELTIGADLSAGVYIIVVQDDNNSIKKQIVKIK